MANTFNRQPLTFSMTGNYSEPALLTQAEFKGISVQNNYVTADPLTFSDAENIYTDEHGVLVSRAPFKFYDGEGYIVDEWLFGHIGLRLHRLLYHISEDSTEQVTDITGIPENELFFVFVMRCYTHETISGTYQNNTIYSHYIWQMPVSALGWDFVPKVTCTQIEEKVFIWFAGIDFIALNTSGVERNGERYLYFEDAVKYLYFPVCKLVVNGIESDLETKNFLTETYRRRHQYSAASSVDFNKHIGKHMSVGMVSSSTSKHLYDITVQENQDKLMIYPYSSVDNDCYIDIVQTSNATVVLKYYASTNSIQISFDGKYFRPVPAIDNILGNPLLTRDGFYLVAFTTTSVAKCKLVAQETTDFVYMSEVLTWEVEAYAVGRDVVTSEIDVTFKPVGYFETIDNFVYIFKRNSNEELAHVLYMRWLHGTDTQSAYWRISTLCDDIGLGFSYDATLGTDVGPLVTMVAEEIEFPTAAYTNAAVFFSARIENESWFGRYTAVSLAQRLGDENNNLIYPQFISTRYKNIAFRANIAKIENGNYYYQFYLAYNAYYQDDTFSDGKYKDGGYIDWFLEGICDVGNESFPSFSGMYIDGKSIWFKNYQNIFLTDKYLVTNGDVVTLPDNGELGPLVTDADRILLNGDNLLLALETDELFTFDRYIHRLTDNGSSVSASGITSGALISCKAEIFDTSDFLDDDAEQYYIEKLRVVENEFVVSEGRITQGQFIRLKSKSENYPNAPSGWEADDDWPTEGEWANIPKPVYPDIDDTLRTWQKGDALPTGPIKIYGVVNIKRKIQPLSIGANGVWYNVDGMLWKSQQSTDVTLELDEYVNAELDGDTYKVDVNIDVPDFHAIMNENYFVFAAVKTGHHLLEVTSARRDEEKLFSKEGTDLLLYLPKANEQKFSNEITNLHPLSDTELGIFTENDIWYISMITNDDGTVVYSSPVKSKLPLGCRRGDGVITALDGQAIIFPTSRGMAALAPQDFIATTEKSLTYLSDTISGMYDRFYTNSVMNLDTEIKPQIAIKSYKYWVFFYKYMDREILFVDTRTGGWWRYITPYPIHSIVVGSRLRVIMQLDANPTLSTGCVSLLGVSYLFTDKESDLTYEDDVAFGFHSGITEEVIDYNAWVGDSASTITKNPMSMIPWHFTSQRLHFNQINNYKAVKGITLNLKGTDTLKAKLWTKAYRDLSHPEKIDAISIPVNEMRTFAKRLNIVRVANFQYTFENDVAANLDYYYARDLDPSTELEPPHQLVLDALTIKYEVKERIR